MNAKPKAKPNEHRYVPGRVKMAGYTNPCEAEITWTWDGKRFSMSAAVWLPRKRDIIIGGQCVDEVASYFPDDEKAQQMRAVWERWHLNDMRAGCEHQRANPEFDPSRPVEVVTYKATMPIADLRRSAEKKMYRAAVDRTVADLTDEEMYAIGPDWFREYTELQLRTKLEPGIRNLFSESKREKKTAGWVNPDEHEAGILCKPCPVCGYKYGSAWLFEELPADVVAIIESWGREPAAA